MINIIIGIVVLAFSLISGFVCVGRTPENLRGWYGTMFWLIAIGGIIGGVCLILSGAGLF